MNGRHFDKTFSDMFVVKSSTNHIIFYANYSIWLVAMATKMNKFEKILKINSLDAIEAKTFQKCSKHQHLQKHSFDCSG